MKFLINLGYILIGILVFILFNKRKKLREGQNVSQSSLVTDKLKELTNKEEEYIDERLKKVRIQKEVEVNPNLLLTKPGINDFVELKDGKLVKKKEKKVETFMGNIREGQTNREGNKFNRTIKTSTLKPEEKNIDPLKKKIVKSKPPNETEPSSVDRGEDICDTITGCDDMDF